MSLTGVLGCEVGNFYDCSILCYVTFGKVLVHNSAAGVAALCGFEMCQLVFKALDKLEFQVLSRVMELVGMIGLDGGASVSHCCLTAYAQFS